MSHTAVSPVMRSVPSDAVVIVCVDCDSTVFEWSTPHVDRCWECAEAADQEAGR